MVGMLALDRGRGELPIMDRHPVTDSPCFRFMVPLMPPTRVVRMLLLATLFIVPSSMIALAAPKGSGLPLPRFVSLQSEEANLRTGPGLQYPIAWIYHRRSLPLEVIAEYRTWRKVRDWQGTAGWMHQSMLSGQRTLIVTAERSAIQRGPEPASPIIAIAESGVIGRLLFCPQGNSLCRAEFGGREGWIGRDTFWGIHPDEALE